MVDFTNAFNFLGLYFISVWLSWTICSRPSKNSERESKKKNETQAYHLTFMHTRDFHHVSGHNLFFPNVLERWITCTWKMNLFRLRITTIWKMQTHQQNQPSNLRHNRRHDDFRGTHIARLVTACLSTARVALWVYVTWVVTGYQNMTSSLRHLSQPRSQGPLSTSRKYPGCGWSWPRWSCL